MKLRKILSHIPGCSVKGSQEIAITGISANSKSIAPGNLFIAKKGKAHDGGSFVYEAIEAGAVAILTDLYNPALKQITQILHPEPGTVESQLAAEYYRNPSDELLTIGITGTNGKTTTSFIVKYLTDIFSGPVGLIGSIEYRIGSQCLPASRTTPDVTTNHRLLREMLNQGCRSVVMEVTSHALMQGRVDKIDFDVAVFTNLTRDHLDYHETMDEYCRAKSRLFQSLGKTPTKKSKPKCAVVNQDCEWTPKIISTCAASVLTYAIDRPADLKASQIRFDDTGTWANITYKDEAIDFYWPLIGRFNVYNSLAAIGVLLTQGFTLMDLADKFLTLPQIRGRLEQVKNESGLKIYVDYAHTPDALKSVLTTLKEVKKGKLITVFGCGGDRDKLKRPQMAKVCGDLSDLTILTSDNPRSENPESICRETISGFTGDHHFTVELDRYSAIKKAILEADRDDLILIAGKGHETYQVFAHRTIEFDDCQVALEICSGIAKLKGTLCGP